MAVFLVPRRTALVRWRGTLEGLLPEQHPARFFWQILSSLDFSELEKRYVSARAGPGRPAYHPRVLAALWIYGMNQGLETAAGIAKACRIRDDFRWLAGGLSPSDQTLLNFITASAAGLASIWVQVLKSMHQAGHIDLSVIAEDGTKLRANASPRSFLPAADVDAVIERLKTRIADKLQQIASCGESGQEGKAQVELRTLRHQLSRAELAAQELDQRLQRREERASSSSSVRTAPPKFTPQDFRSDLDRNILICPADQELRFIGQYSTDNGRGAYRLYGRSNCGACSLKTQCTDGSGRRVKVLLLADSDPKPPPPPANASAPEGQPTTAGKASPEGEGEHPSGPRASITEPEAVMMLATSEKRWEPSYNADLAVTRHGIIVSQFLTKDTTDFHHFLPALQAVMSTVGKPESWVGDGHYGTQANVLLADRENVFLYAPPAQHSRHDPSAIPDERASASLGPCSSDASQSSTERFARHDFRHDPERDVLVCPANQELRLIGVYSTGSLGAYRLYGRSDCRDCSLKSRCTEGKGRRLKMPAVPGDRAQSSTPTVENEAKQDLARLLQALDDRMKQVGDAVLKFRRETIEPVNAQLKQHGLGRFHVRGVARCEAVLTLACIAHNLIKWKAREAARSMKAIA